MTTQEEATALLARIDAMVETPWEHVKGLQQDYAGPNGSRCTASIKTILGQQSVSFMMLRHQLTQVANGEASSVSVDKVEDLQHVRFGKSRHPGAEEIAEVHDLTSVAQAIAAEVMASSLVQSGTPDRAAAPTSRLRRWLSR